MSKKIWSAVDTTNATHIGIVEFQDNKEEFHTFEVVATPNVVVFGGACNVGLLQSGYIEIEPGETVEDTMREMYEDLETYYNYGPQYVNRIVVNERM